MKRLIGLLLIVALLCGLLPTSATANEIYFSDVTSESWYYESVQYAVNMSLMNGVGNNCFAPNTQMSRAMLVTVLWRYAGSLNEGENIFTDVKDGQWYTDAIAWAAENEIVSGIGNGKFDPDGTVTREQLAAVLYRYSQALALDTGKQQELSGFPDASAVSTWAQTALSWAVAEGLLTGNQSGTTVYLDPQGNATRAQVATILMRYIESYSKNVCPHSETELRGAIEATCTTNGYTGDVCCTTCGYRISIGTTISKLFHNYVDDVCTLCGERRNTEALLVAGNTYALGMSEPELTALAGSPDETLPTIAGYTWYVYGTTDYTDFFMAGIYDGQVISLCATGVGFCYRGKKMGDDIPDVTATECRMRICTDQNDNDIFYAVHLTNMYYADQGIYTPETLAGESKANFHLTNAFRVYHGRKILTWSDAAATSARLHCEDMAAQNYFDHYSLDGRSPGDRMSQQGIQWSTWGENICAGYRSAFEAYDGWVNSEGHRKGMLNSAMAYMGVGFAVKSGSTYFIYAGQNFYA